MMVKYLVLALKSLLSAYVPFSIAAYVFAFTFLCPFWFMAPTCDLATISSRSVTELRVNESVAASRSHFAYYVH